VSQIHSLAIVRLRARLSEMQGEKSSAASGASAAAAAAGGGRST
jgi:hypothetical protein